MGIDNLLAPSGDERTDVAVVLATFAAPNEFGVLIERYEAKLRRYMSRLGLRNPDDQADVLQEVFIKAYRNLHSFDTGLSFSSWLYRIAHNETMTWFRRRQVRPEGSLVADSETVLDFIASSQESPETRFDQELSAGELSVALGELDAKYREVLVLRYFEHKEYEEISDILQIPIGSVGTLLHRGKKQLAAALNKNSARINKQV